MPEPCRLTAFNRPPQQSRDDRAVFNLAQPRCTPLMVQRGKYLFRGHTDLAERFARRFRQSLDAFLKHPQRRRELVGRRAPVAKSPTILLVHNRREQRKIPRRAAPAAKAPLGNPHDQPTAVRLCDFLMLAALDSSACRSSPDISGSKVRTTPSRPTMLGSDRVTPSLSL